MDLFDLYAKLSLDTSGYENGLDGAQEKTGSFASKLKSGLGSAVSFGASVIQGATNAVMSFGQTVVSQTGSVASYGDNIDKMSQKMGLSAKAYQEWDAVMQHSGTSVSVVKAGMRSLTNAVQSGSDAFKKLGMDQSHVASLSSEDLFAETITALQNMEDKEERTYLASQLLGRGAMELGALLNTSAEDTQKMKDRVNELGGVMSDKAVKAAAAYQDSLQDMQTAYQSISRNITAEFLPAVTSVMDGLTDIFAGDSDKGLGKVKEGLSDFMSNLQEAIPKVLETGGQIISVLADAIIENLPMMVSTGVDAISNLAIGIVEKLPDLVTSGIQVIETLVTSIGENLPAVLEAGGQVLDQLVTGIEDMLPDMVARLPQIITGFLDFMTENLPSIIQKGTEILNSLVNGIIESIPALIEALPQVIQSFTEFIASNLPQIVSSGVQILVNLATGIIGAIPQLIAQIPQIISGFVSGITAHLPEILMAGIRILSSIGEGVIKAIPSLASSVSQVVGYLTTGFKGAISVVTDIGKNIVKGIWNGISAMGSWIKDKVTGFFSGITNSVKGILGIHSPSKVFAGLGKNMALGLGEGWDGEYDRVKSGIEKGMKFGTASIGFDASGISRAINSGVQIMRSTENEKPLMVTVQSILDGKVIGENTRKYIRNVERAYGVA